MCVWERVCECIFKLDIFCVSWSCCGTLQHLCLYRLWGSVQLTIRVCCPLLLCARTPAALKLHRFVLNKSLHVWLIFQSLSSVNTKPLSSLCVLITHQRWMPCNQKDVSTCFQMFLNRKWKKVFATIFLPCYYAQVWNILDFAISYAVCFSSFMTLH